MMRKIVDAAPMDAYRDSEYSPRASVKATRDPLVVRNNSQTAYHPIGTCRMGPAGPSTWRRQAWKCRLGRLRVICVDLPDLPRATNAPSIMVGEKMADILKAAA